MLSIGFALLFYIASFLLVVGVGMKIYSYAKTPAPLKIPTMPAPLTKTGVGFRLFREVFLFESLFKSNKWIWLFGYLFHFGMLIVLLRHLRYFTVDVWWWVKLIQPFGIYASFAMVIGLLGLLARRILVDRVRYISGPSDYLMLILLIGIGASGMGMKFVAHTDIIIVKTYMLSLIRFDIMNLPALPTSPALLIHLALVAILMIIFPISKLLHGVGIFFSPTRNQVDNSREKRHIAPWAKKLEEGEDR